MSAVVRCPEPAPSRDGPLSTGFLIFRAAASTLLVLIGLVGAAVVSGAGYMLVYLWRNPPEPPGQLAAGGFLMLAAIGVATALGAVGGLVLLAWRSRQLARRAGAG